MEQSRLNSFARDVAVALYAAPLELRRRAAEFAANWVVTNSGLMHPDLTSGSTDRLATLVIDLDERYFAISEARDPGQPWNGDVLEAFGKARAASAVEFMLRGEYADSIYEAAAAAEDWSELRSSLLLILRNTVA